MEGFQLGRSSMYKGVSFMEVFCIFRCSHYGGVPHVGEFQVWKFLNYGVFRLTGSTANSFAQFL